MMTRSVRILVCLVFFFVSVGPSSAADPGPTNGAPHKSYLPLLRDELQPVIPETTEVLTDTTTQYLSAVSPDGVVYAFGAVTPELAELDPGDVMVGGVSAAAPYGFLRRVTSVASVGSGIEVMTEPATLGDALEQGEAYFNQELSPEDLRGIALPEGVTLATPMGSKNFHFNIVNAVLYDHDGNHATTDDQIRANGALDLLLGFDFTFRIKGGQLKTLDFIGRVTETADLQVGADIQIASLYKEYSLTPPVTLSAITFFIGPIPVVITPVLSIFIGLDGDAHVGVTASVTQQAGLTGGVRYANGDWYPVAERTNTFLFDPPHAYASLNMRAFGGARLAVLLYGVTGPYMTIDLYLALRVDTAAGNWIDLYGGMNWLAGVRVEIFGRKLADFNRIIARFENHLFRDSLRPPPTFTPTPTATPTATPPPLPLTRPNGLAVDPNTHRVYVTSRDSGRVFALDGATLGILGYANVGALPWGVGVNPASGKLYVANFGSGTVSVLNAANLSPIKTIAIGAQPTFIEVNPTANKVYVVSYGTNALYVINGANDTVEKTTATGGVGAWGLAYNPTLNRLYVGHRDTRTVTSLDGNDSYRTIPGHSVMPCGASGSPFGLGFNPNNGKLYAACAPAGNVNVAAVYLADANGLASLASAAVGNGGANGGGGVAVDTATGNVFFTNSLDDTVSVISGASNTVIRTLTAGDDPFGAAVDPATRRVYVGNRGSNNLSRFTDAYTAVSDVVAGSPAPQTPQPD